MRNLDTFFGKPVKDFAASGDFALSADICPRVRIGWDDEEQCADRFARLLAEPGVEQIEALVIGSWFGEDSEQDPDEIIELLVSRADALPNLRALFFGDVTSEENEMSWITQGDMSSLWGVYPKMEEFVARGGNNLRLGRLNHGVLRKIAVETGGMPATLLREALEINAPIQDFEVWLGSSDYGASTQVSDFDDLLTGKLFPQLKRLGLMNCEYADDLATAVSTAPIMDRLVELDLSMGTLTDRGARALLAGGKLGQLECLTLQHHYVSDAVLAELKLACRKLVADATLEPDNWGDEEHYYIAVSE